MSASLPARSVFRPLLSLARAAGAPLALAACATTALAQQPSPAPDSRIAGVITQMEQVTQFHSVALSPDGNHLAWAVSAPKGAKGESGSSEVFIADPHGQHAHRVLTAAKGAVAGKPECQQGDVLWSPDSRHLALLSNCADPKQEDVYLADAASATGSARQLTHLHGEVQSLAWSPDGKRIGFLYVPGATRPAGALAAMKPPSGVIGVEGLEIQRVAAADAATGAVSMLTPDQLHVYEFDWSPDSARLTYIAAPPPGENNWWVAKLYTQGVPPSGDNASSKLNGRTAFDPGTLFDPATSDGPLHGLQIAVPRWSPDGSQIAFIGGLMSDQGSTGGDVYLISLNGGGAPKDIMPDATTTPGWLAWTSKERLIVAGVAGGSSRVSAYTVNGGSAHPETHPETLLERPSSIGDGRMHMSLSLAGSGAYAFIDSSESQPPEVYTAQLAPDAQPAQITHANDSLTPPWGKMESVAWTNDSFQVQGWLQLPAHYDPAKRYPLLVMVHGGPSSAVTPRWPSVGFGGAPFSTLGYFVLYPNPRGSYGQGERFVQANRQDFGYGDLCDILAGVNTVEKKYPIDDARLGLTGWSYGGFMTMFAVTQTNRFHAAVAGAGISDWQSYYGENSIDQWMIPFFGKSVYDDPAVYAKSSAIDFIKQVKTPTLVVVGDRDGECPAPQSFEFWHALRAEGVPTELVVYPNEGHGFRQPAHRQDVLERAAAWFTRYLPAEQPASASGQ
ncbi:MAG: prolyl oligopeptidase family serine peptidase [Acidobacteriaceae bacterium]